MSAEHVKISAKLDSSDMRQIKMKNASAEESEIMMFGTSRYKTLSQPSQKFFFKKNPIILLIFSQNREQFFFADYPQKSAEARALVLCDERVVKRGEQSFRFQPQFRGDVVHCLLTFLVGGNSFEARNYFVADALNGFQNVAAQFGLASVASE